VEIQRLKIEHFRLIEETSLELAPGANLFVGENAQGKTTILEAVSFISTGRSFRTNRDRDCIAENWDGGENSPEPFAAIEGEFLCKDTIRSTRTAILKRGKSCWIDGKPLKKLGDLWGLLNTIIFVPSDLELVQGAPSHRRSLLGSLLACSSRFDLYNMQRYAAALKQRNALLKTNRTIATAEFQAQEELMADHGARLLAARQRLIERLSPLVEKSVRNLTGGRDDFSLGHESGWPKSTQLSPEDFSEDTSSITILKEKLLQNWKNSRQNDRQRGFTEQGPHRGDISLILNNKDARLYASQGQARTLVLALRLAEAELLEELCCEPPILLLDDVLGELDRKRSRAFLNLLASQKTQALITTTDATELEEKLPIGARFEVIHGRIKTI
jgi:DNA replication and repair protein RecF